MNWIEPIPGFDLEKYPFILISGENEFWIANVNEGTVQTLVTSSSAPFYAQPGMTFVRNKDPYNTEPFEEEKGKPVKVEDDGEKTRCVFAINAPVQGTNKRLYSIYEMVLFQDFKKCLTDLGKIPEVSVERTIELAKE